MRAIDEIDYPQTAEEWWALVEYHRCILLDLIAVYHPEYRLDHDHKITARKAEVVRQGVVASIVEDNKLLPDPQRRFEKFLKEKNRDMSTLLNEVWWGMPESYESRGANGFGVLCDLCSEAYVLYDEDEQAERVKIDGV